MSEARPVDLSGIVTANDIRGVAGEQLTVDVSRALGAAFADFLDAGDLIVAHDMRLSSPDLAEAFAEGAVRRGSTVAFSGLSATDQLYSAAGLHAAAGAMFTASHNPATDNGIKLCRSGAAPISRETGLDGIRRIAEGHLATGKIHEVPGGRREQLDTLGDYIDMLLTLAPVGTRRPLRVVVDAANAMAGLTVPALAARLETVTVVPLHFELDGTFPNHPADPLEAANLRDLQETVVAEGADLGLAFDGDADRCVVVDESGAPVPPSAVTALIAAREIARARAAGQEQPAVVANLVSSRHVAEAVTAAGGRLVHSPVGHSLIKALMAEHEAVFGGEHSAHYYFRDFFFADSGMLAALHVMAALTESDQPLSRLVAEHDRYVVSGEINFRGGEADAARESVRTRMARVPGAEIDDLDGLTVTCWDDDAPAAQNWWLNLRSSNTEPLLRLNVEAAEHGTMERVRDEVLAVMRESRVEEGPPTGADIPGWVRELLVCPVCHGQLRDGQQSLVCTECGRDYIVEDGLPVVISPLTR